jgi:hypothetical protein
MGFSFGMQLVASGVTLKLICQESCAKCIQVFPKPFFLLSTLLKNFILQHEWEEDTYYKHMLYMSLVTSLCNYLTGNKTNMKVMP